MRSLLQTALGTIPALRKHPDDESALLTRMAAPLLRSADSRSAWHVLTYRIFYRPYSCRSAGSKSVGARAWSPELSLASTKSPPPRG